MFGTKEMLITSQRNYNKFQMYEIVRYDTL